MEFVHEASKIHSKYILVHYYSRKSFRTPIYTMAVPTMTAILGDGHILNTASQLSPEQCMLYSLVGLGSYLALASTLRFQRRRNLHRKYPYTTRESMGKMTDQDAFTIQKTILQMEFPFIVLKSLQFALFRVRIRSNPQMLHTY
jgi:hypothetical protein